MKINGENMEPKAENDLFKFLNFNFFDLFQGAGV